MLKRHYPGDALFPAFCPPSPRLFSGPHHASSPPSPPCQDHVDLAYPALLKVIGNTLGRPPTQEQIQAGLDYLREAAQKWETTLRRSSGTVGADEDESKAQAGQTHTSAATGGSNAASARSKRPSSASTRDRADINLGMSSLKGPLEDNLNTSRKTRMSENLFGLRDSSFRPPPPTAHATLPTRLPDPWCG